MILGVSQCIAKSIIQHIIIHIVAIVCWLRIQRQHPF